jgi:hypothetical protein
MEWSPISERIILACFKTKISNLIIIQCYAPTELTETDKKEEFYQQLKETTTTIKQRDVITVTGDMNAKVGSNNEELEHVMSRHGIGNMNKNGELFSELCASCDLITGETVFLHKICHKVSWVSPDNQIDHLAISKRFSRPLLDVRNKRGADIDSDHHLRIANFRYKILVTKKKYNAQKLQMPNVRGEFKFGTEKQILGTIYPERRCRY